MVQLRAKRKSITKKRSRNHFLNYKAYSKLLKLAKNPPDLTQSKILTPQRIESYCAQGAGYSFLFGTERVNDKVLGALNELAFEAGALEKMAQMQAGEVMNYIEGYPSENRQVLHTALRDFFSHSQSNKAAKEAAKKAKAECEKLKNFIKKIDQENRFTDLIVISIGGSELGPKANYLALEYLRKKGRRVHFIGNIDPDNPAAILNEVQLKNTLVCVISKSGTTLETCTNEHFVRTYFKKAGLNPDQHFLAVTCPGTPMDSKKNYREVFHIFDWVGGRYSASGMVGGVLLSFAYGFDVYWEFLRGAHEMDQVALKEELFSNLPLLGALLGIWNRNFLGYPAYAMVPYSQALSRFPAHLQQVDMESNGKRIDQQGNPVQFHTGPIPFGEPGTNAQHSFYQLIHQGTDPIPLELVGFKKSQYAKDVEWNRTTSQEKLLSNLFAQAIALATGQQNSNPNQVFPGNRPSHILLGEKLTPLSLGALFAYFEHKVAFQGFIWGINSFDQEGVQLGKNLANRLIDLFAGQSRKTKKGVKASFPLGQAFLEHLDQLPS